MPVSNLDKSMDINCPIAPVIVN